MKPIITLLLIIAVITGCAINETPKSKADVIRQNIEVITVDGCEYLYNTNNGWITPKRNCKNCIRIIKEVIQGE